MNSVCSSCATLACLGRCRLVLMTLSRCVVGVVRAPMAGPTCLDNTFPVSQGVERGTPCYMAPELFAADGVHSFSSDLWALVRGGRAWWPWLCRATMLNACALGQGCVLYELYIGHPPFVSDSLQELVDLVTTGDLPLPAPDSELGMSSEFQSLLLALLDKDPQHRIGWCVLPRPRSGFSWPAMCLTHRVSHAVCPRRDKLLAHPFWSTAPPPPLRPLPPQPQFAAFLERHAGCVVQPAVVPHPLSHRGERVPLVGFTAPQGRAWQPTWQ